LLFRVSVHPRFPDGWSPIWMESQNLNRQQPRPTWNRIQTILELEIGRLGASLYGINPVRLVNTAMEPICMGIDRNRNDCFLSSST
jgi:hypothetical protein